MLDATWRSNYSTDWHERGYLNLCPNHPTNGTVWSLTCPPITVILPQVLTDQFQLTVFSLLLPLKSWSADTLNSSSDHLRIIVGFGWTSTTKSHSVTLCQLLLWHKPDDSKWKTLALWHIKRNTGQPLLWNTICYNGHTMYNRNALTH